MVLNQICFQILEEEFRGDHQVHSINIQALRRDFLNLKMKESENVKEFHIWKLLID